jgi:hypothetical protein
MIGDQLAAWLTEYLAHLRLRLGCLLVTHHAAVLDVKLPLSKPTTAWLDNWLAINSPVFCLPKLNAFGAGYKSRRFGLRGLSAKQVPRFPSLLWPQRSVRANVQSEAHQTRLPIEWVV